MWKVSTSLDLPLTRSLPPPDNHRGVIWKDQKWNLAVGKVSTSLDHASPLIYGLNLNGSTRHHFLDFNSAVTGGWVSNLGLWQFLGVVCEWGERGVKLDHRWVTWTPNQTTRLLTCVHMCLCMFFSAKTSSHITLWAPHCGTHMDACQPGGRGIGEVCVITEFWGLKFQWWKHKK